MRRRGRSRALSPSPTVTLLRAPDPISALNHFFRPQINFISLVVVVVGRQAGRQAMLLHRRRPLCCALLGGLGLSLSTTSAAALHLFHLAMAASSSSSALRVFPSEVGSVSMLGQAEAARLDEDLMAVPGFSVDQLMELAGLSVACAIADAFPLPVFRNVYVLAGPGNNGGDGLVASRHLVQFGYNCTVVYPKPTQKPLYVNLLKQCQDMGISILGEIPSQPSPAPDVIVDSIFGFSFKGEPRPPFNALIKAMVESNAPIVSVDIPSGWDVEEGDVMNSGLSPAALVSLTAPKLAARFFKGRHYLGGRFVTPIIASKYDLLLPAYPGTSQCVELKGWGKSSSQLASEAEISWGSGEVDVRAKW